MSAKTTHVDYQGQPIDDSYKATPNVGYDAALLIQTGSALPKGSKVLERISRMNGLGSLKSAITSTFYGINLRGFGVPVQLNTDNYGLTFFTRPRLNLSYNNCIRERTMSPLITTDNTTMFAAIRALLDPVGARGRAALFGSRYQRTTGNVAWNAEGATSIRHGLGDGNAYPSPMIDDKNPFMAILGNTVTSASGWPDPVVDTYTSKEGRYREQWSMIDGFAKFHGVFDLSVSFRNMNGSPLIYLFYLWSQYAAMVHEGVMDPYPEMIIENEIDYQTRIYRLVLDAGRQYVQQIGACGAAFPTSNNLGALFNFTDSKPHNTDLEEINVTFRCVGALYLDPILVDEFNQTVQIFNSGMLDSKRADAYQKCTLAEKLFFNFLAYPRIEPNTMELEWWVDKEIYKSFTTK